MYKLLGFLKLPKDVILQKHGRKYSANKVYTAELYSIIDLLYICFLFYHALVVDCMLIECNSIAHIDPSLALNEVNPLKVMEPEFIFFAQTDFYITP